MRTAHLFAGIGGMALAARWNGWTPQWVAEIDPYASRVLAKNFPGVPNLGDVKGITGQAGTVDILTGGFPCQDISLAGRGAGLTGERSGLWFEYARLIGELQPRYVLAENVSALRSRGLDRVLGSLAALGYDAEWHCIPAAHIGAPHRRDRIWITAWRADADRPRLEGWLGTRLQERTREWLAGAMGASPSAPGGPERGWWVVEPELPRVAHGVPHRVDRLRCLGNTIVPQEAYLIFKAISDYEAEAKQGVDSTINPLYSSINP